MITRNKIVIVFSAFTAFTAFYSNCTQVPTGNLYNSSEFCTSPGQENCEGDLAGVRLNQSYPPINIGTSNFFVFDGECSDGGYPVAKVEWYLVHTQSTGVYKKGTVECVGGRFVINDNVPNEFLYGEPHHLSLNLWVYDSVDSAKAINNDPRYHVFSQVAIFSQAN